MPRQAVCGDIRVQTIPPPIGTTMLALIRCEVAKTRTADRRATRRSRSRSELHRPGADGRASGRDAWPHPLHSTSRTVPWQRLSYRTPNVRNPG
jgi:hypothetical protein